MLSIDLSADSKFDTEISDLFSKICYDNRENFNELIMKCSDENKNEINLRVIQLSGYCRV